ncbi:MAG: N-6 DNA methylase [Spirochaetales bacterium]|nr:N-6 DNA methylase [Spirochaetales bacterium]
MILYTLEQVASILQISKVSVRNWEKHGYITSINKKYNSREIDEFKTKLNSGEVLRLNNRANKSQSKNKFIPSEYIVNNESIEKIEEIVNFINTYNIKPSQAIFLLCINLFVRNGEIDRAQLYKALEFEDSSLFKRSSIFNELKDWYSSISSGKIEESNKYCTYLINANLPQEDDILGIIYQSIIHEGKKSQFGSYYTPKKLVEEIVEDNYRDSYKVLDPCCGTGQFLLTLAKKIDNPLNIWGCDIDEIGVRITRLNLLLFYKDKDFIPNIFCNNSLINWTEGDFDLITTNPPWGASIPNGDLKVLKEIYPHINSKESFSYFLSFALKYLKNGGSFSYVLPESVLYVKNHLDIRLQLLDNIKIKSIQSCGRLFKNVFSQVIRMDGELNRECNQNIVKINVENESYNIPQDRFIKNRNMIFDIYCNEVDQSIINKVFSRKKTTLEGHSSWALGIVTGNNNKFLQNEITDSNEPIFKGKELEPLKLGTPSHYIEFNPEKFQQCSNESFFRAKEKLVYKFISKDLVFAYDDKQHLTLNSANIVIPQIDNISVKIVGSLLNSSIYRFTFRKKINAIKILRGDIEYLPIPDLNLDLIEEINNLLDDFFQNKIDFTPINEFYYRVFQINAIEKEIIENFLET